MVLAEPVFGVTTREHTPPTATNPIDDRERARREALRAEDERLWRDEQARQTVRRWLREQLAGGARLVSEVRSAAEQEGLGWAAVKAAARDLEIQRSNRAGDSAMVWSLPGGGGSPALRNCLGPL